MTSHRTNIFGTFSYHPAKDRKDRWRYNICHLTKKREISIHYDMWDMWDVERSVREPTEKNEIISCNCLDMEKRDDSEKSSPIELHFALFILWKNLCNFNIWWAHTKIELMGKRYLFHALIRAKSRGRSWEANEFVLICKHLRWSSSLDMNRPESGENSEFLIHFFSSTLFTTSCRLSKLYVRSRQLVHYAQSKIGTVGLCIACSPFGVLQSDTTRRPVVQ